MMNTVNTEFSFVEVWFTNQVSKAIQIEDNFYLRNYWIDITCLKNTNCKQHLKMRYSTENMLKVMIFSHLQKNLVVNIVKN